MTPERWRQIEEIFQTALEHAPEERTTYLANACGSDAELHKEVTSLLAQEIAHTSIENPIRKAAQSFSQSESDNLTNQHIGPYRITNLIGEGGMGAVYRAVRDDEQFEQQVAIKIIKIGMETEFVRNRFTQERRILARLEHPNIAHLMDGGTTAQGQPYFVMEYVEGQTIHNYCVAQQLSLPDRLQLFRRVCAAVQYAHQNLVVHRDLKPGNILVTADGAPKLLDFGIAKLLTPDTEEAITQTETAMRLMTPDYASPEQVRGLPITTASDIYSLGVILYELLTDHRPHQFSGSSPLEMERVICETVPNKPSDTVEKNTVGSHKLARQLAGDLDNIVLMALRKEPERRYASAEQFAEDIRRYLDGLPVIARYDTFTYRTSKFVRRNKLALAAAALIVLSLIGGIFTTAREARIAQAATVRAETERARAEHNLAEAKAQRTEAEIQRADAVEQRAIAETQTKVALHQSTIAEAQTLEAENQRGLAEAQFLEAENQRELAEAQTVAAQQQRVIAETERNAAERRFGQVRKLINTFLFDFHTQIRDLAGSTKASEMVVKTALEYLGSLEQEADGNKPLQAELAGAYFKLGTIQGNPQFQTSGQPVEAMASFRKSLGMIEKLVAQGEHDFVLLRRQANVHFYIALLEHRKNDLVAEKQHFQQTLKIIESLMATGQKDDDTYWLLLNGSYYLAEIDIDTNGEAEELPLTEKMVAINERWLADFPGERARSAMGLSYKRLGNALCARGNLAQAVSMLNRAITTEMELRHDFPHNLNYPALQASIHQALGKVLGSPGVPNLGRSAEAITHYRQALGIMTELVTTDPKNGLARTSLNLITNDLALVLMDSAPQEAAVLYQKMLSPTNGAKPAPAAFQLTSSVSLARALWRSGDHAGAIKILQEVESSTPKDLTRNGADLQLAQGLLLLEMGEPLKALTQFQLALPPYKEGFTKNPNGLLPRRQLMDIYEALGRAHIACAQTAMTPPEQKLVDWRAAQNWYQQSLNLLNDWPRWAVSSVYDPRRAVAAVALKQCENALR